MACRCSGLSLNAVTRVGRTRCWGQERIGIKKYLTREEEIQAAVDQADMSIDMCLDSQAAFDQAAMHSMPRRGAT